MHFLCVNTFETKYKKERSDTWYDTTDVGSYFCNEMQNIKVNSSLYNLHHENIPI